MKMKQKNIVFYFSDQQRWDTVNETLTPNLMQLAAEGVKFDRHYTCQPVCGPARACLQTGLYATQCGVCFNGISLPREIKGLAQYFNEAGYETAYIGKWHLASDRFYRHGVHCANSAIPRERQGGYQYFRGADVLEATSHGYDGYVFNENGNRLDFKGYRADCINDFAIDFLRGRDTEKPFFLFVSQLEPHHQNDRGRYEGFRETVEQYKNYPVPDDLTGFKGDWEEMYPDYCSAVNRLDYNVGRLVTTLKDLGLYEDTVIVYTSDHGSHFKTRNAEYKRSCHESSVHVPLIIRGGSFIDGRTEEVLTSLIDLPPTLLSLAGIPVPPSYMGFDLSEKTDRDCVFIQISEASNSRAIRTKRYKYAVRDALPVAVLHHSAPVYFEDYLYDLEKDGREINNLIKNEEYADVRRSLRKMLQEEMKKADEKTPLILPAVKRRKR